MTQQRRVVDVMRLDTVFGFTVNQQESRAADS